MPNIECADFSRAAATMRAVTRRCAVVFRMRGGRRLSPRAAGLMKTPILSFLFFPSWYGGGAVSAAVPGLGSPGAISRLPRPPARPCGVASADGGRWGLSFPPARVASPPRIARAYPSYCRVCRRGGVSKPRPRRAGIAERGFGVHHGRAKRHELRHRHSKTAHAAQA